MELLRLGAFFSNAALTSQLSSHLAGQLAGMPEEAVLEVGAEKGLTFCVCCVG